MGVQEQYLDFFEGPTLDIRDYRVKVWRNLPPAVVYTASRPRR